MLLTTPTLTYNHASDISALIICKDEAAHIQLALQSLSGRVAQIVVVDTGSGDATPQICARHGVDLHFHAWTDDFAAARNHALQFARHPWILALDADEVLSAQSAGGTNKNGFAEERTFPTELMQDPAVGAFRVHIKSALPGDNQYHVHKYPRLFRNHPHIRYRGAVHEQIGPSVEVVGLKIATSDLLILHSGYAHPQSNAALDVEGEGLNRKTQRNRAMLERELSNNPDDVWLLYHLGQTEFSDGQQTKAAKYLQQALKGSGLSPEQINFAELRLAQIALAGDDLETVTRYTNRPFADVQLEGFRKFLRGLVLTMRREFGDALDLLEASETKKSSLVDQDQRRQLLDMCRAQVRRAD